MEVNPQKSTDIEIITKKNIELRTLLNWMGIVIFLGCLVTIWTMPLSLNRALEITQNEEIIMSPKKIKELLLFVFGSAIVYFFLVNFYFVGRIWRKIFFVSLILFIIFSLCMVVSLY
ncbi:hypothetical protein [Caldalkalibacillus mannanilyticus]|uniref:hypothetical protein n=1 Tax=Caldalkalibacillus mannanilyticus TaxID=1418 RepID=UPI0004699953|nr:hypothetical protein [Caldalkalibacillus mannanilyticus]